MHSSYSFTCRVGGAAFWAAMLVFFSLLLSSKIARAQNADAIVGHWLTGSGKAHVEVYKQSGKYFGKIVWLKTPLNEQGKPKVDKNNPEDNLKDRPLMGLVNLWDFVYSDGEYEDGKIYDPESGKTYSCIMKIKDDGTLSVRGYIGISLIGRTDVWQRVKG